MNMKIMDVLADQELLTVPLDSTLGEVATMLRDSGLSGVPVVDDWGALAGVITSTDVLRVASPHARDLPVAADWSPSQRTHEHAPEWENVKTQDTMNSDVCAVTSDTELRDAARAMANREVHRVIVLDAERKVVGVLSAVDIAIQVAEYGLAG